MHSTQKDSCDYGSPITEYVKPSCLFKSIGALSFTNSNLAKNPLYKRSSPESYSNEDVATNNLHQNGFLRNTESAKKSFSKAERRAEHNATERARRECLNSKFQCLAQTLPNLMHHRRPSKSQIVEKALDWVKQSTFREQRYRYQILQLQRENKQLLAQCNSNQQSNSYAPSLNMSPITCKSSFSSDRFTVNHARQKPYYTVNDKPTRMDKSSEADADADMNNDKIEYHNSFFEQKFSDCEQIQAQSLFFDYPLYGFGFHNPNVNNSFDT